METKNDPNRLSTFSCLLQHRLLWYLPTHITFTNVLNIRDRLLNRTIRNRNTLTIPIEWSLLAVLAVSSISRPSSLQISLSPPIVSELKIGNHLGLSFVCEQFNVIHCIYNHMSKHGI